MHCLPLRGVVRMNSKWKAVLIISIVFNIAVIGAMTYGFAMRRGVPRSPLGEGVPPERLMAMRCRMMGRELGLDRDQIERVESVFVSSSKEQEELRKRLAEARAHLFELLSKDNPDEGEILERIDEISAIQGQLEGLVVKRLLKIRKILPPEQRREFLEMLRCRMDHKGPCPGGHRPHLRRMRKGGLLL
ncbi:hypothetical protein DRQ05_00535 [bacterium]|nr:MAG: hypothetical protein DRQ05_00535 [bacterium]